MPSQSRQGQEALANRLIALLEERAPEHGVDIVDVEVTGSSKAPVVRVRIDHADEDAPTITLDEVTAETDWISAAMDEADPFPGAFTLEVSSPGLSRPLRRAHDFERFAGETVALTTRATEGRRRYTGELLGLDDEGRVAIRCDEGKFAFALDDIRSCTIKPDFDAIAKAAKRASKPGASKAADKSNKAAGSGR